MDRDMLFRYLEQRYISKRDMISRVPLGVQPDALWQELLNQRRSKSTVLPLYSYKGTPYWFVTTDKMIAASEKIVEALYENDSDFDPYAEPPTVSTLEEIFFTSYVEGSQMTMQAAMDFLTNGCPPRDIEEQLITNNRMAGSYASANLYRPIEASLMQELTGILTDGIDNGGQDYRTTETVDYSGETLNFPSPQAIPDRVSELSGFLASPLTHPLIKAAVAQAYIMILRPFPEGNERLGRLLSSMILLRAGYTFFSDVSLSALIARKSYGYYEAMANILREENGGDLTYFLEYFLELLSRAVDERRLRITQRSEQARLAEQKLAKTPLSAPTDIGQSASQTEEVVTDLSGFQPVALTDTAQETPVEILKRNALRTDKIIGQVSALLLTHMKAGNMQFTAHDIATILNLSSCQLSRSIRELKEQGVIQLEGCYSKQNHYVICGDRPLLNLQAQAAGPDSYDQAVLDLIGELMQSKSHKDKRIGRALSEYMVQGEITEEGYVALTGSSKWAVDMQLAAQLGLVEKVSDRCYAILKHLKKGIPSLSGVQKRFITKMYESFGDEVFSSEMVVATLDYSGAKVSAYLHQFTLLKILDCRKEDGNQYQFLVNPAENPECFVEAA